MKELCLIPTVKQQQVSPCQRISCMKIAIQVIQCSICALCYYEVSNFIGQILQENFNSALDSNFQSRDLKVWAKLLKIIDSFVGSAHKSKDLIKFIITKLTMYFKDSVWFLISLPSFMYCMIMFKKGFFFCLNSMNFVGMIVQKKYRPKNLKHKIHNHKNHNLKLESRINAIPLILQIGTIWLTSFLHELILCVTLDYFY